jgi:hypothetical protein
MRRLIAFLTVALIMAAIIVLMAVPAFAQGSPCGEFVSGEAQGGGVGGIVSELAGPGFGQFVAGECNPAR